MATLTVDIVLSTYNGERFLADQISSIQHQKYPHWKLWLRDDGSKDSSPQIIQTFIDSDSRISWSPSQKIGKNLGVIHSFNALLEALPDTCELFALCDQDDKWRMDKLDRLVEIYSACTEIQKIKPVLLFSDLSLINEKGEALTPSHMSFMGFSPMRHIDPSSLAAQNIVVGCSLMGNHSLLKEALPIPQNVLMHDWWLALIAAFRGNIFYCPFTLVEYRQHPRNVSGGSQKKGLRAALQLFKSGLFVELMGQRFEQIRSLKSHFEKTHFKDSQIEAILEISQLTRFKRILRALDMHFLPQGFKRSLLFFVLLFIWKPRTKIHP